jgi:Predicted Zn-dependent proteases and their inactivated homologs
VRLGEVETLEHHRDRGLGVTVYFGTHRGSASSTDFSAQAIKETVRAACAIACYTAQDPCAGLADAELMANQLPDLELCHPWDLSMEQAIDLARACEAVARAEDPRITNSEGAIVTSHAGLHIYGNTHGFLGTQSGTRHAVSCTVVSQEGDRMQRDGWYTIARDPTALEPAEAVGRKAARRTVRRLGARPLSTRRAPVLFAPEMARGLLGHFVGAIGGVSLYRRASFLLDHLGKRVFPDHMLIQEQPHLKRALSSAAFDSEGVATQERLLVAGGVLAGYVLDSYSARKLGMQTTGNAGGVRNLTVAPGELDERALLREMGSGLVVTELMGQGVNLVTGDYSRGAAGFWVEGGDIQFPVEKITIAGNLRDMFQQVVTVGNDMDTRGNIRTGSLLIASMTIAGD